MIVYGLCGKSGTGKSYQALNVCREKNIRGIIDDGLFICDNVIYAGHSAKRAKNTMTAVKTAIFQKEREREAVAEKIRSVAPESILVLGTSERMIHTICLRLGLPEAAEIFHIEEIASPEEIRTAMRQRSVLGKHVIPVPTVEVKNQFSGYFLKPIAMFREKNGRKARISEKTVVRPTYSYLGEFTISEKVVLQLVKYVASGCSCVAEVKKCSFQGSSEGVTLNVSAELYYETGLREKINRMQKNIAEKVAHMTAFNILQVNIMVRALRYRH